VHASTVLGDVQGPRPHVVAVDEETGAVALSAMPLTAVTRGVVVAVRTGAAPLKQCAEEWTARAAVGPRCDHNRRMVTPERSLAWLARGRSPTPYRRRGS
jgi:hypothetical protein